MSYTVRIMSIYLKFKKLNKNFLRKLPEKLPKTEENFLTCLLNNSLQKSRVKNNSKL